MSKCARFRNASQALNRYSRARTKQVSECRRLTPGLLSALCPRFRPDGQLLLFLSHEAAARSGVHCATAALHTLPWPPPGTPFKALRSSLQVACSRSRVSFWLLLRGYLGVLCSTEISRTERWSRHS